MEKKLYFSRNFIAKNFSKLLMLSLFFFTLSATAAQAKALKMVYADGYRPYSWMGDENKPVGIEIDILEEILRKRMGIDITHTVCPWIRCQNRVKNGESDAYLTIPTAERRTYTEVSELPFFITNFVIYTGINSPKLELLKGVKSLSELKKIDHIKHLMLAGSGWAKAHIKNDVKIVREIKTPAQILKMLSLNRADAFIEQAPLARYEIKVYKLENKIVEIPTVMDETHWHLHLGKKSSFVSIMPKLNKLMKEMKEDGSLQELALKSYKKYQ